jgi:integrase
MKRRARGTGSIFRDARRGGWVGRVPVGRDTKGKPVYREFRATSQEEVVSLMRTAEPPSRTITVREWYLRWFQSLTIRESTRIIYEQAFTQRIIPAFGERQLSTLNAHDLETAITSWGDTVSASTIRLTIRVFMICVSAAVRAEVIPANRLRNVRIPRATKPAICPFTITELNAIIEATKADVSLFPLAVAAGTGCRIGEALGLQPADYNEVTGELTIRRTRHTATRYGPPKSGNGLRTIVVPEQVRFAMRLPYQFANRSTLFTRWRKLLASLNIEQRNIHQLRHTFATLSMAAGVPLADIAKYLGDTVATVVKTYVHSSGYNVGQAFQNLLGGAKVADNSETPGNPTK